ncbi:hypothetical protein BHE74_00046667 [Ensete ventricosum]|nr:hypothetical protein GW17_00032055 [Ensete ventricosum]RWW47353.1 hypothetical protein BHE74_00046667 [Ensete ventricosum]
MSKLYSSERLYHTKSFLWCRNLSSHAGVRSGQNDDDLEDGFSDLEVPPEDDAMVGPEEKEDDEELMSEEETNNAAADALSLLDSETDVSVEKKTERTVELPLSKIIIEAPRYLLNGTLDKWVEEGNPLGRGKFSLVILKLRKRRLYGKALQKKKIADVLLTMEKENVKPNSVTYRLLIDMKGRAHDITGMEQILDTMKAEGVEPDLLTHATVARYYVFSGLNEKAEATLREMEGDDIKENRAACRDLISLYALLGKADDVERIWKICMSSPGLRECLAAIEAWGKLGQVEKAEEVFENMFKAWKGLSTKYYNALLKVYANNKLLSKGKELAKRMSDNGCYIGPMTWDALIKLYAEVGELEKADSILLKASKQNEPTPLYGSYITVLNRYSARGDIHNAEKIFQRLRQTGYAVRLRPYQLLLQTYINAKSPAYGFRERMKADNISPTRAVAIQLATTDAFRKTQISELLD